MSLAAGTRLGQYEILAPIGAGGMGEVYRARDTRLDRDVAIKVLPAALAHDPERLARFEREAKVLASLNHPNIAHIYGVEERALVMELVEGIEPKGPISFDEAWKIVTQIASALEYAHDKGIVHRDLKPDNIKITPDGTVKLLDFGLAKAFTEQKDPSANPEQSPTLTIGATEVGVILGTAAYMAPEQAKGKAVDKRADIWAFGVVFNELLTGERLFKGEDISETLVSVLRDEPDLTKVPVKARRLLRRCLEKNPKERLRDIGEARFLLDEVEASAAAKSKWPWIAAVAVLAIALAGASWIAWRATRPVVRPSMHLSVDLGPDAMLGGTSRVAVILSPDGRRLVYLSRDAGARTQLSTRLLAQSKSTPLAGTEDAADPFFSPDGQWIGFFVDSKLKKISVEGGAAVTLCDAPAGRGASWGEDGHIIAALNIRGLLSRIPDSGGAPQPLTRLDPAKHETSHRFPQVLPGGKAVLFSAIANPGDYSASTIDVQSLATGERKTLHRGAVFGRYLPSGHLVYVQQDALFAEPMDLTRLAITGPAVPLLEEVANNSAQGAAQFDFSRDGDFIYVTGKGSAAALSLSWLDNAGKTTPLTATPGPYLSPSLSPDGKRVAYATSSGVGDVMVYDWQRDATSRLSFTPGINNWPMWTPDGRGIVYQSETAGSTNLYWVRSDGAAAAVQLTDSNAGQLPTPYSFSPDGKRIALSEIDSQASHLSTLPMDWTDPDHPKAGKPEEFLSAQFLLTHPAFSSDGRWLAYVAQERGAQEEVYVRPFPASPSGGKWQVSVGGGRLPVWSRNGHELFYQTQGGQIMAVGYTTTGGTFVHEKPRLWSEHHILFTGSLKNYDPAPDGKRFAIVETAATGGQKPTTHVNLLLNFYDELRRRVPLK